MSTQSQTQSQGKHPVTAPFVAPRTPQEVKEEVDQVLRQFVPAFPHVASTVVVGDPSLISYQVAHASPE